MLVILERSRILNHRATRESVGTYNYVPDALQIYYILIIFKKNGILVFNKRKQKNLKEMMKRNFWRNKLMMLLNGVIIMTN